MNICVLIPAAGTSQRFGDRDKLNQDLGGRPLLLRTIEIFTRRDEVNSIVVAAPPDTFNDFADRFGDQLRFHGAKLVAGGRLGRWESVRAALHAGSDDCTHIAVHDAARPCVSDKLLDRLFETAESFEAVIPTRPVTSTIKRCDSETIAAGAGEAIADAILGESSRPSRLARKIIETVDREGLCEVQTPQVFTADLLRRAYEQENLAQATDDASLIERLGETVYAIEGEASNLKVTTPADLQLIRSILGVNPPAERAAHKRF